MEYVYAAMILHKAKKDINEESVRGVLEAADINPDDTKIRVLVSVLKEVDIDEAIKNTPIPSIPVPVPLVEKKEVVEDKEVLTEEAATGLDMLFGNK